MQHPHSSKFHFGFDLTADQLEVQGQSSPDRRLPILAELARKATTGPRCRFTFGFAMRSLQSSRTDLGLFAHASSV